MRRIKYLIHFLFILTLFLSNLAFAETMEQYICDPLNSIDFTQTQDKPSDVRYIPLFQLSQSRLDEINREYFSGITDESVEDYCGIMYDCGQYHTNINGEIVFRECNENNSN